MQIKFNLKEGSEYKYITSGKLYDILLDGVYAYKIQDDEGATVYVNAYCDDIKSFEVFL